MGLRYTIQLPPPGATDVTTREVTVTVEGMPAQTTTLPGTATEFQATFDHGQNVSVVLVDIDAAGNKSQPSEALGFTASDTFAPPKPGGLAVSNVEEVP